MPGCTSRISAHGGRTGHEENVPAARKSHAAFDRRATRTYDAARGVASADRLTDLRIKQARTPRRRRFHCRSGFCGRVGAFVLGFCPFIGDSLGRAAG